MLRRSFLPPISEYELAADLFSRAADALIANDLSLCDRLIREAALRPLRDFDSLAKLDHATSHPASQMSLPNARSPEN